MSIDTLLMSGQAVKEILDNWRTGINIDEQFVLDRLGKGCT